MMLILFHGGDIDLSQWVLLFIFWGVVLVGLFYFLLAIFKKRDDK